MQSTKARPDQKPGTSMTFVLRNKLRITFDVPKMYFLVQKIDQQELVIL
uniref:Uncharacterized protein n=1 Tax=Lotus japonicus TaxID=34305 RepID=I3T4R4_LOTJA|nr:unknown [Lotus japonicus]